MAGSNVIFGDIEVTGAVTIQGEAHAANITLTPEGEEPVDVAAKLTDLEQRLAALEP